MPLPLVLLQLRLPASRPVCLNACLPACLRLPEDELTRLPFLPLFRMTLFEVASFIEVLTAMLARPSK